MTIRNLQADRISLNTVWEELVYTDARLKGDRHASDLAPQLAAPLAAVDEARRGQFAAWQAEILAQAQVDGVNDELDDAVVDFADTLLFTLRDRTSPRYGRYFTRRSPHAVVRLGLASQVELVRSWPESLRTEPEEALRAFAPSLAALVEKADAALAGRDRAAAARADHRVRVIEPLVDQVNSARNTLYGALVQRAEERKLGRSWPESFFRLAARRSQAEEETSAA